jgi:hypothetical protein
MPPRTTAALFESLDPTVFTSNPNSFLYKYLDALAGTTGAGSLVNQIFLANLNGAIETCYFGELDYIFGNINFMARTSAEAYSYDPQVDQLTSGQWDEVRVKDAWFRARIKDFFAAVQLGCTPEGIRKLVQSAIATDCTILEVWRYADNFGITSPLGRTGGASEDTATTNRVVTNLINGHQNYFPSLTAANAFRNATSAPSEWEISAVRPRNEVVVVPHKTSLSQKEKKLLRDMMARLMPMETFVTVDLNGLAVSVPVKASGAASDSSYFEVIKTVTPTPLASQLPAPEYLPIDLLSSEQWLLQVDDPNGTRDRYGRINKVYNTTDPREAPYAAFLQTSEYSYYYLTGGGKRSAVDSVTYDKLELDGSLTRQQNFQRYRQTSTFTQWQRYEKADSPDNFPGGKFGRDPRSEPAINPDGTNYSFPYESQSAYVTEMMARINGMGGEANENQFKLPIQKTQTAVYTYYPETAVANYPPAKDSTISASVTRQRPRTVSNNLGNPSNFTR